MRTFLPQCHLTKLGKMNYDDASHRHRPTKGDEVLTKPNAILSC